MQCASEKQGQYVLASAASLSMVLGSVHGFSVLIEPLEAQFHASRAMVSLTYSLALVGITLAVLFGHLVFGRFSPGRIMLGVGLLATTGALLAGFAPSLSIVWLGYSLLFGLANGLGYGFGLQIAAQANPHRGGLAMGIVTASYALGAVLSPYLYSLALGAGGFRGAMIGLAVVLMIVMSVSARLMFIAAPTFAASATGTGPNPLVPAQFVGLWVGYGAGVAAGLMTIGHATGIAASIGFAGAVWLPPAMIAVANMAGSLAGGFLVDRTFPQRLFVLLPLLTFFGLLVVLSSPTGATILPGLGIVGFGYGALIATYPASIAKMFGPANSARVYGRVFSAWGVAGLLAPWLAGMLFDLTGQYTEALQIAIILSCISAVVGYCLRPESISA